MCVCFEKSGWLVGWLLEIECRSVCACSPGSIHKHTLHSIRGCNPLLLANARSIAGWLDRLLAQTRTHFIQAIIILETLHSGLDCCVVVALRSLVGVMNQMLAIRLE